MVTDTPQTVEITDGRRIGMGMVDTVTRRVAQLRRVDDFIADANCSHWLSGKYAPQPDYCTTAPTQTESAGRCSMPSPSCASWLGG